MLQFEFTVLSGPSSGDKFHFRLDDASGLSIGRGRENDLVVSDPKVSKYHASIELRGGRPYLLDLDSTHGTWLMGFEVGAGQQGALVGSGDEFKVGDTLFKAEYEMLKSGGVGHTGAVKGLSPSLGRFFKKGRRFRSKPPISSEKKQKIIIAAGLFLLLVLLIWPGGESKELQRSQNRHSFGVSEVVSIYPNAAKFVLPVSDQLIEYEFRSGSSAAVFVGDLPTVRMPPHEKSWQRWVVIVRDSMSGGERNLLFRASRPTDGGGVWNVRNMSLSELPMTKPGGETLVLDRELSAAAELAETLGGDPHSLHSFLRTLQRLIVVALAENRQESVGFPIRLDSFLETPVEMSDKLRGIISQRKAVQGEESEPVQTLRSRHLETLMKLAAEVDAELWRIYLNRIQKARLAAKAKNYGDALRSLIALKAVFSDESDFRWQRSDDLLHNKKLIPKKVLRHKERYLRNHKKHRG